MNYFVALILLCMPVLARGEGDYILSIDGKSFELSLGAKTNIVLGDGQKVSATLKRKEVVTFHGRLFSFEHKSTMTPQRSALDVGLHQTLMATPIGTCIIVQELAELDSASLIDLMVKEVTWEEVKAGYKLKEEKVERKLSDGTVLKGKKVVTTFKDEQWIRHVVTHEIDKGGIVVLTMIHKDQLADESAIIDAFWSSFKLKKGSKK